MAAQMLVLFVSLSPKPSSSDIAAGPSYLLGVERTTWRTQRPAYRGWVVLNSVQTGLSQP
eukprot:1489691-Pyramimonas_sp.AAC.1